jgi:SAM-dependent methyltransferase
VQSDRIRRLVETIPWYHTIELQGVLTPGRFDHRPYLPHYQLPLDLEGQTVLDVGCSDGFFSFELESRGARRVVAIDGNPQDGSLGEMDYSPALRAQAEAKYRPRRELSHRLEEIRREVGAEEATTFHIAKALRGSRVERRMGSIYRLAALGEAYDVVFCGTVSEHLKNPLAALEELRSVTKGLLVFAACGMILPAPLSSGRASLAKVLEGVARRAGLGPLLILPDDTLCRYTGHQAHNSFFRATVPAMKAMLEASGFSRVELRSTFVLESVRGGRLSSPHAVFHGYV